MQSLKPNHSIFRKKTLKMKYIASFLFAIVVCLVVLTEVANCAPEADANADPFFFGGFGGGRGFGGGYGRGGYGREGGGYGRRGGYGWGR
jgi:uncharacterized membrane protein